VHIIYKTLKEGCIIRKWGRYGRLQMSRCVDGSHTHGIYVSRFSREKGFLGLAGEIPQSRHIKEWEGNNMSFSRDNYLHIFIK